MITSTYLCVLGEISPIKALPDEILLTIFDFCRADAVERTSWPWTGLWPSVWRRLVHVCQRWRYAVFSSPLRLDLRLHYTDRHGSSLRKILGVWPPFPIEICCFKLRGNIIAALEHRDRICELGFEMSSLEWGKFDRLTQLQKPFPALRCLRMKLLGWGKVPALSTMLLGGSAPSLRSLYLHNITFPTLPQFLLSCNDLSELHLQVLPCYITPETAVTVLSALAKLTWFEIGFERPDSDLIRLVPPPTCAVLPALTVFIFCGVNEYSEDLLARIDIPQLETLSIMYKNVSHVFDIPQVISHSLPLGPFHRAEVIFSVLRVGIRLYQSEEAYSPKMLELGFNHYVPDHHAEAMRQISILSPLLSSVTELDIRSDGSFAGEDCEDLMYHSNWLVLFHVFASVRTLRLSSKIRPFVVSFIVSSLLGHTEEGVNDVLPELQDLYLTDGARRDEPEEQAIELLIAAGQNFDHNVTVHRLPYHAWYELDRDWRQFPYRTWS
jgi:F-box-like